MSMKDLFDKLIPAEDEYDEEEAYEEELDGQEEAEQPAPKFFGRRNENARKASAATAGASRPQVQVVLVKPTRYEDAPSIADHLNARKTVVLNMESANREVSRRLLDFLSGSAYSTRSTIKKVANSTYIITPANVDVLGELITEEAETGSIFE